MNDHELMKLAAKAAGLCTNYPMNREREVHGLDGLVVGRNGKLVKTWWNPRDDDADAFLLALHLEMPIHPGRVWKSYREGSSHVFIEATRDVTPLGDPAATRRAILEVAAEVGRAMP